MPKLDLDPTVDPLAPSVPRLTPYDDLHRVTYLRLLDADAEGADWQEVARIVLHLDPQSQPGAARRTYDSHLARAKWMTEVGFRQLLRGDI